jgi:hypothetical protein
MPGLEWCLNRPNRYDDVTPQVTRVAEEEGLITEIPSGSNCIHERRFESRQVCLKYLCHLRLRRICDGWKGEEKTRPGFGGSVILTSSFDHYPDEDGFAYLRGGELSDEEGWTPLR